MDVPMLQLVQAVQYYFPSSSLQFTPSAIRHLPASMLLGRVAIRCRLRCLRAKNARAATIATPASAPITIPAIAPPEMLEPPECDEPAQAD